MASKIKVTLIKSMIRRPEKHRKILRAMGLTRVGRTVVFDDTLPNRGMINKVRHLVSSEEI